MPHVIQVRKAIVDDAQNTRPCRLESWDGVRAHLRQLNGKALTVRPQNPDAVHEVLARDGLTHLGEEPLALVSRKYKLLGIAFGPAHAPSRLELVAVVDLESDPPSIPPSADQPGWFLFDLV